MFTDMSVFDTEQQAYDYISAVKAINDRSDCPPGERYVVEAVYRSGPLGKWVVVVRHPCGRNGK